MKKKYLFIPLILIAPFFIVLMYWGLESFMYTLFDPETEHDRDGVELLAMLLTIFTVSGIGIFIANENIKVN